MWDITDFELAESTTILSAGAEIATAPSELTNSTDDQGPQTDHIVHGKPHNLR